MQHGSPGLEPSVLMVEEEEGRGQKPWDVCAVPISLRTTQEYVVPNGFGGCTNHQGQKEMLPLCGHFPNQQY